MYESVHISVICNSAKQETTEMSIRSEINNDQHSYVSEVLQSSESEYNHRRAKEDRQKTTYCMIPIR